MGIDGPKGRATFSLSPGVMDRLEQAVPKSERSRFVEEALDEALRAAARRKAVATIQSVRGLSSGGEDSTDFLRRKRREWDGRMPESGETDS